MDTSEVVSSGDKIFQGINFSALKNELNVQKLWQERTWQEILKHFVTAFVFGALGSFIDISTDGLTAKSFIRGANYTKWVKNLSDPANHNGCIHTFRLTSFNPGPKIEYEEIVCFEQDPVWGWLTVGIMFLPGYFTVYPATDIILEMLDKKSSSKHRYLLSFCMICPCIALFPLVLVLIKLVCLLNPGPEWKRLNIRMTGFEGSWESSCQTILTLFIFFTRTDREPSSVQIASLVVSFTMITKTAIADHLSVKQPMELKDELRATATLLPLFLSNGVFKVLSLAIMTACLRYIGIAVVLFNVILFGFPLLNIPQKKGTCCPKRLRLQDGDIDLTSLQLKEDGDAKTRREKMENCVNTNFHWAISHFIVLTCLVSAANTDQDSLNYTITELKSSDITNFSSNSSQSEVNMSYVQSVRFSKRPGLVENLPLLNGLYVGIVSAIAINAILFYFQMWKPMVVVEEEEEEVEQMKDEEGEQEMETHFSYQLIFQGSCRRRWKRLACQLPRSRLSKRPRLKLREDPGFFKK